MSTIRDYFTEKAILVTGATGFLGKALVEKLLRDLPGARLFLLIRPRQRGQRTVSAEERFRSELLKASVFDRLKGELGDAFDEHVERRVTVVAGDLADHRLGVSEADYQRLTEQVQVLINSAAVVVFDERLDLSLNLNTLGAKRMLDFARDCRRLEATVHISTCYVSGTRRGWVEEDVQPFSFDADEEAARLQAAVTEVKKDHKGTPEQLKEKLVALGLQHARSRGWNDTYTYTKALGEQLLRQHRGDVPVAIVRPSIIESSFTEPEPGWIDGFRMSDPLIVGYGKGYLKDFPGKPDIIADLIPCDHVVNTILVAAPRCARDRGFTVYQVASGELNPVHFRTLYQATKDHFQANPMRDKRGRPIPMGDWTWPATAAYRRKLVWRYRFPLTLGRALLRPLSFIKSVSKTRQKLKARRAALDLLLYYVDIYSPYTNLEPRYQTRNTAALWQSLSPDDQRLFPFDVRGVDWHDYIANIHIPGLKKHVLNLTSDEEVGEGSVPVRTISDLLARSADRYAEAVALQMKRGGEWLRLTYDELERRVSAAASVLHHLGVHKGDRVLLYAENCPEWGVVCLGVLALGAVVVPVDLHQPEAEVLAIAEFTEARVVLTSPTGYQEFSEEARRTGPLFLNVFGGCRPFDTARAELPTELRPHSALVGPDDLALILFTTSARGRDPRGVLLTHRNFLSNVLGVAQLLPPKPGDNFVSILPLNHALEFTGGFLVPLYAGARVTYCESMRSRVLLETIRETEATALIGTPRVFQVIHGAIRGQAAKHGKRTRFDLSKWISHAVQFLTGRNIGRRLYSAVHQQLGGKMRAFISGGAPLTPQLFDDFTAMGFALCEGYGLSETGPIATVNPLHAARRRTVGIPLPGVEVRTVDADERGVGAIVVRGPNVTAGYWKNPEATARVLSDGWLHTGDVGQFDRDGYLRLTGRSKEMIVTGAGKKVYPDEVEDRYADLPGVKQFCVVGLWDDDVAGEMIHAVVVPDAEAAKQNGAFEETLRQAIQLRGGGTPRYQRLQRLHFLSEDLPRTPAGAIDRPRVQRLLVERLRASGIEGVQLPHRQGTNPAEPLSEELGGPTDGESVDDGVVGTLARLSGVPRARVTAGSSLEDDLHLDPSAVAEALLELETQFRTSLPENLAPSLHTVRDVLEAVRRRVDHGGVTVAELPASVGRIRTKRAPGEEQWLGQTWSKTVLRGIIRRLMWLSAYGYFGFEVRGREHLPQGAFIVASSHSSHLDTGAIVTAFGDRGHELFVMGARDYFFNNRIKGWLFHSLLNVIPFDRTENVIEGLRLAEAVLCSGRPVLIYPEGRRSPKGELQPFKPGIGLLGVELGVPIVPCCVEGSHAAMPKGRAFPWPRRIRVTFAPPVTMESYRALRGTMERRELWRRIADDVRGAVVRIREQSRKA